MVATLSPIPPADPAAARERVLAILRGLLEELGSQGALPILAPDAHLERDLGLGSLERVELMARLEYAFAVRLPDSVITSAETPEQIAQALLH